ncbi:MAG: hypothetical protein ACKOA8_20545, partial [Deltaproteobacteria bacterium]
MNFKVLTLVASLLMNAGISSSRTFGKEVIASEEVNTIAQFPSTDNDQATNELSEDQIETVIGQFEGLVRSRITPSKAPSQCDSSPSYYRAESSQITAGSDCLKEKKDPCKQVWEDCLSRKITLPLQCT